MKKYLLVILLLLLTSCASSHRENSDMMTAYTAHEFTGENGEKLLYRLLEPLKAEAGRAYPLVIFLHGAGERGDDNRAQLVHGTWLFEDKKNRKAYPAYVIAPQCPEGQRWADLDWDLVNPVMADKISAPSALLMELIDSFTEKHPVDKNRLYITGLSMGGYGTWDLIMRYPDMFAAAAPVCGGGDTSKAQIISHIPIRVFHGADDPVVPPANSRDMVDALKRAGSDVLYTEYPGVGHGSWVPAYEEPDLLPWMFSRRKK